MLIDGTKTVRLTHVHEHLAQTEKTYYVPRFVYYREDSDSFEMRPPIGIKSICVDLMEDYDMRCQFHAWLREHGEAFLVEEETTEDDDYVDDWLQPELTDETFEYRLTLGNA